jgi:HK97 gp10 family phage protein
VGSSYKIEGTDELFKKLRALSSDKELNAALKDAVRKTMREVMKKAKINLQKISPGATALHKTYKGRWVSSGFAQRSVRMIVTKFKNGVVSAVLGVRKEAFYVLQFWELGTSKLPSIPWLQPAFYQSRNEQIKGVGEVMKARIERIAAKKGISV